MKIPTLIAAAMALATLSQNDEASAAGRRGRMARANSYQSNNRPLMTTPETIIPRAKDLRAVPNPGGGRLVGYTLNLHPGGRAARMLFAR
jgi:hypothetical protein